MRTLRQFLKDHGLVLERTDCGYYAKKRYGKDCIEVKVRRVKQKGKSTWYETNISVHGRDSWHQFFVREAKVICKEVLTHDRYPACGIYILED